jgi:hypothetical protein
MEDCADTTTGGTVLSDAQFEALMVQVHKEIEDAAVQAVSALSGGKPDLFYPPNAGFTAEEQEALAALPAPSPALAGALRKVIADAAAKPLFGLFVMLDGVSEPEGVDDWPVWELTPSREDNENFHDEWLDAYWTWRERRPDPGWRLDEWAGD